MAQDRYTQWLKIPPGARPPDHYTLLGLPHFCDEAERVEQAAHDRLDRLDKYALSNDAQSRSDCQRIMNEVAQARVVLMDAGRRFAYDVELAAKLGVAPPQAVVMPAVELQEPSRRREEVPREEPAPPAARPKPPARTAHAPRAAPAPRAPVSVVPAARWSLKEKLLVGGAAAGMIALTVVLIMVITKGQDPSSPADPDSPPIAGPGPTPPDTDAASKSPPALANPTLEETRARCMARLQECRDDASIMPLIEEFRQPDWQSVMRSIERGEDVSVTPTFRAAHYEKAYDKLGEVMADARRSAEIIRTTRGPYDEAIAPFNEEVIRTHAPTEWTSIEGSLKSAMSGAMNHEPGIATQHFETAAQTLARAVARVRAMNLILPVGRPIDLPAGTRIAKLSPDGKLLVLGFDASFSLWDDATGRMIEPERPIGSRLSPKGITFSPDGKDLVVFDSDVIWRWDLSTLKLDATRDSDWVTLPPFLVGGKIVCARRNKRGELVLYDMQSGKVTFTLMLNSWLYFHAVSEDGKYVMSLERGDILFSVFDTTTGQRVARKARSDARTTGVRCAFRPDGQVAAFGQDASFELIAVFDEDQDKPRVTTLDAGKVERLEYSPDGSRLVVGVEIDSPDPDSRHAVVVYDPIRSQFISSPIPAGHTGPWQPPFPTWRFSPDGKYLALAGSAGRLRIVNLKEGVLATSPIDMGGGVVGMDFAADAPLLAVNLDGKQIRIVSFDPVMRHGMHAPTDE